MPSENSVPLWAGRTLALVGILTVALNLRVAVAAVSPIADVIARDIPLDSAALGVLGAVAPAVFAVAALFGVLPARRFGLERVVVLAILTMAVGHIVRAIAPDYVTLVIGTVLAIGGGGLGNVLLPPLVKKYFPDRIGLLTAGYSVTLSIGASTPPVLAVPLADAAGWRFSLGIWAVLAVATLAPWVAMLVNQRRARLAQDAAVLPPEEHTHLPLWRSPTAWAIGLAFSVSAGNAYAIFAWLAQMLIDIAGVSRLEAGAQLALFALVGLPAGIVVPPLAARMKNVGVLLYIGVAFFVVGYLGLLLAPQTATAVWVFCVGAGPLIFPVCLALIGLRARTESGAIALSGFGQGVGYAVGSVYPIVIGVLHDVTGGWDVPLVALLVSTVAAIVAGLILTQRRYVEDEVAAAREATRP
ncbi:MFS transporter [Herbiconiux sp. SYSU D00978]|uniref:MFS transporter n=1 Tax=Herbiconiux sp. SYSU D00978 TaxID=2812562 RepID=UPI0027DD5A77|nr:MFS transporter [Herbiconiux sp. SYSU D00978]